MRASHCTLPDCMACFRFPRSSIIFLYRDLAGTVRSFMSVMEAVRVMASLMGDRERMMDWWCQVTLAHVYKRQYKL